MIKKLLIANRGEIACRIIKTAKKLGIETVAVYSEADTNALHVKMADTAIFIGDSPATSSYLNHKALINAIKASGADAVHPGYGFVSENGEFAAKLEKLGIIFVGPSSSAIKSMGDKVQAKKIAKKSGVNVVPGYIGAIKTDKEALKIAEKIGYPIMLKAVAGGGGKGIRVVRSPEDMIQAFSSTRNEAKNSFSDERTFIEKFIEDPRHIEIQVIADQHGNYVCLGERECSIQRNHQKVIEEAPSSFINEKTRKKMYAQSIALAKKVGYYSAGTVEFIVDAKSNFYFLEMNTRLQVEHPVTELITKVDIVELMLKVAAGEKLPFTQKDIQLNGWAIESRIYAEDPTCGFLPSTGRVEVYREPEKSAHIRVDTGIYEGGEVSMFYDPMIAKLCSYAEDRRSAINEMCSALDKFVIRGISHNISFLQSVLKSERFIKGDISTNFIAQEYKGGFSGATITDESSAVILCSAIFIYLTDLKRNMDIAGKFHGRSQGIGTRWVVMMNNLNYPVTAHPLADDGYKISFANRRFYITSKWILGTKLFPCTVNGKQYTVQITNRTDRGWKLTFMGASLECMVMTPRTAELRKFMKISGPVEDGPDITASISGRIVDVKINVGDLVVKGQPILVMEAMKMENIVLAPNDGVVIKVHVKKDDLVMVGDIMIEVEPQHSEGETKHLVIESVSPKVID